MNTAILTKQERNTLLHAFAPYARHIDRVGILGSRATGKAGPASDIDIVLYGDLDVQSERRLWTMLDETELPVAVDLVVYSRIKNALLKSHIDAVCVELFTCRDLLRANAAAAKT
jgi:predicted nucleotidyltransferase